MKTGLIANPAKTSSSTHLETSWPDLVSTPRTIAYLHQSRRWLSVPWRGNWTCGQGRMMTAFLTSFVNDYSWGDFKGMQTYGWTTSTSSSFLPTGAHAS